MQKSLLFLFSSILLFFYIQKPFNVNVIKMSKKYEDCIKDV